MASPTCVHIEVLGPVRAWWGGSEVPLGSPQQRGVLTLLALAGGQPVMTREIVEALWGEHPPPSAVNVVQTYIKRLRRMLEPDRQARSPSMLLPSVPGGYALVGDPDTVDIWRYRQLVQHARGSDDTEQALKLLAEALQLWRGSPGGDLPALTHHHRLQEAVEEHATVTTWFAEMALRAGRAAMALPVVARIAATRPFDEPLHAQLLRLYHALGRRADAVQVYLGIQQRLNDQFGFDPGPELTAAYRDLLRDRRPGVSN